MNGQELFEKLNSMTEDERKVCQFWQLTDRDFFDETFAIVRQELNDDGEATADEIDAVKDTITSDDIADIGRRTQNIEAEMEDEYTDGFDDTYCDKLKELVLKKVENNR